MLIGTLIIGFIERRNNLSQAYGAKLERLRVFFSATPPLIAGSCSAARTADRPIILVFLSGTLLSLPEAWAAPNQRVLQIYIDE